MKVAITGAGGAIGSAVVEELTAGGDASLRLLASSAHSVDRSRERWPQHVVMPLYDRAGHVDPGIFEDIDVLVHLGWSTVPATAAMDPRADLAQNVWTGLELMDAAGKAGIGRFVFLSSGGTVYGDPVHLPIREDHPTRPITAYGASKLCFEQYLRTRAQYHGFEHVILRPSNVYGRVREVSKPQGVIEHWMDRLLHNTPIQVWNAMDTVRDYLHIDDMVATLLAAMRAPVDGMTLNVGTGVGTSLAELLSIMGSITGREAELEVKAGLPVAAASNILDPSACARYLVAPSVALREGLHRLWARMRNGSA